ncbi:MAG: protein-disulfide reductase DsbD [Sulfuricurvum sp.]|jgi:thiol:disulfide interchange protein DsbD|uniref:protein-disulfide reductase DsbD n=1 Tax=Sulfuricurvum sp. TaxID=2025608 RepID=UPI0025FCE5A7|nr:protein-disulfide reductase DsbD [Sulfuricurvum sp.]MCK9373209.1 protein-disulfide reductase DsbD [Sulfuricurvum sp.]
MRFILILLISLSAWGVGFLQPEEAFNPKITQIDGKRVQVEIRLGEKIYLYADKVKIEDADTKDGVNIGSPKTSTPTVDHEGDPVYDTTPVFQIDLSADKELSSEQKVRLNVSFQGCSSAGLCYEPQESVLEISVDGTQLPLAVVSETADDSQSSGSDQIASAVEKEISNGAKQSETDQIAGVIKGGNLWVILLSFFGFGLLLALTPCVFPMIPIISSVIVAQGSGIGTKRAFFLSLVYVLSMAVAYTIAGILAGLFGANLQAAFQTPWIITLIALIFVVLSLSMFDLYELQIPNSIQSRISRVSGKKGGILGIAIMGFLSALIVGPCVAAPLAGALIYIGQTGDAFLGGAALFALSIGMGIPLLIVGITAGKFMPRPGAWMDTIKSIFGVMLIGVAIWMVSRIVEESITVLLWGILAALVAINMGALEPLKDQRGWSIQSNKKAFAFIALLYAIVLLVGGISGATSPLRPLEMFIPSKSVIEVKDAPHKSFLKITSLEELNAIVEKNKGKKVMVDFYADWCTSCKEFEAQTFSDEHVKTAMDAFVLVQVDLTANDEASKTISEKFGIFGPPAILFFDEEGIRLKSADIIGFKEPQEFLTHLQQVEGE